MLQALGCQAEHEANMQYMQQVLRTEQTHSPMTPHTLYRLNSHRSPASSGLLQSRRWGRGFVFEPNFGCQPHNSALTQISGCEACSGSAGNILNANRDFDGSGASQPFHSKAAGLLTAVSVFFSCRSRHLIRAFARPLPLLLQELLSRVGVRVVQVCCCPPPLC